MTQYLISFDAHAMDHIPDEDMPAVAKASHEVVQEAINAGVWVFGGGLENQKASIVATDRTVTDGPYPEAIGGVSVVDVPSREEALEWAAQIAVACRCAQEVREFLPDPNSPRCSAGRTSDRTLAQDFPWLRSDDAGLRIDLNWGRAAVTLGSGVKPGPRA
jgi:hypothetical protein